MKITIIKPIEDKPTGKGVTWLPVAEVLVSGEHMRRVTNPSEVYFEVNHKRQNFDPLVKRLRSEIRDIKASSYDQLYTRYSYKLLGSLRFYEAKITVGSNSSSVMDEEIRTNPATGVRVDPSSYYPEAWQFLSVEVDKSGDMVFNYISNTVNAYLHIKVSTSKLL